MKPPQQGTARGQAEEAKIILLRRKHTPGMVFHSRRNLKGMELFPKEGEIQASHQAPKPLGHE